MKQPQMEVADHQAVDMVDHGKMTSSMGYSPGVSVQGGQSCGRSVAGGHLPTACLPACLTGQQSSRLAMPRRYDPACKGDCRVNDVCDVCSVCLSCVVRFKRFQPAKTAWSYAYFLFDG